MKLRSAQDKLAHRRTQADALTQQVSSLEEQLEAAREELSAAQEQVAKLEAEVQDLLGQVVEAPPVPKLAAVPVLSLIGELEQRDPVPEVATALRQLREAQAAAEAQQLAAAAAGQPQQLQRPQPAGATAAPQSAVVPAAALPAGVEPAGADALAAGLDLLTAQAQAEVSALAQQREQASKEGAEEPAAVEGEQKTPEQPATVANTKEQNASKAKAARTSPY